MSPWTPETVSDLTRMWADGRTSSDIAIALKITRNAVMGKIRRLGLHRAPVGGPKKVRKKPGKVALGAHSGVSVPVEPVPSPPCLTDATLGVPLMQLASYHCREVIGKGPNGLAIFCGEPKVEHRIQYEYGSIRSAYCEYHSRINYKST